MEQIADDPIIDCILKTGYPPWERRSAKRRRARDKGQGH